jgi:hypothetical protein
MKLAPNDDKQKKKMQGDDTEVTRLDSHFSEKKAKRD